MEAASEVVAVIMIHSGHCCNWKFKVQGWVCAELRSVKGKAATENLQHQDLLGKLHSLCNDGVFSKLI